MGAVGGSRHYSGGGLGNESGWHCPSCGAENAGPIAGGCSLCGAGRPGYRVGENQPPPPPPAPPVAPEPEPPPAAGERVNLAQVWIQRHPDATLEQAFTAGYVLGVQTMRREALQPRTEAPHPLDTFAPEHLINRTIVAALELFRDQILVGEPEEVKAGEWLSAAQVTELLRQLRAHMQENEAAHV